MGENWTILSEIEQTIKRKIETAGTPLKDWNIKINYGIKTGLNEAFIISKEKRDELIAADPKSAEIIRPILRGRDIKRYSYTFANLYVITAYKGINKIIVSRYPAIYEHLKKYEKKLRRRGQVEGKDGKSGSNQHHWTELDNNISLKKMDDFNRQKIIFPAIMSQGAFFALDNAKMIVVAPGNILVTKKNTAVCDFLTSPICYFALKKFYMGGGIEGELKLNRMLLLPIPKAISDVHYTTSQIASCYKLNKDEMVYIESAIKLISSSSNP